MRNNKNFITKAFCVTHWFFVGIEKFNGYVYEDDEFEINM